MFLAPELEVLFFLVASLIIYTVTGGADFGGGVWDLLASGPRAQKQKETIAEAIAPIWEANHIWLILVIVLLFIAFPLAFQAICTALHIPLTVMLIGIVLRGCAFTFRSYGISSPAYEKRWSKVFAITSTLTPITLGITVGAVASGKIGMNLETGVVQTDFISSWLAPFPFALGFLTLALFTFLAAIYLTLETDDPELQEDFRLRAIITGIAMGAIAFLCLFLTKEGAPLLWEGLWANSWSLPFHTVTALASLGALFALYKRFYQWARFLAILQSALIILGWVLSQNPYIVAPDITISHCAPASVLRPILFNLYLGTIILIPSFWYLYSIFKKR